MDFTLLEYELAGTVLKDFLEEQGWRTPYGSKDSTRETFKRGLIEHGEGGMDNHPEIEALHKSRLFVVCPRGTNSPS